MARRPEVFVRELDPTEMQRLVKITRTARDRVRLRRAGIVLVSAQGRSAGEAAVMFAATAQYAREVIHALNEQGFPALDQMERGPAGTGCSLLAGSRADPQSRSSTDSQSPSGDD